MKVSFTLGGPGKVEMFLSLQLHLLHFLLRCMSSGSSVLFPSLLQPEVELRSYPHTQTHTIYVVRLSVPNRFLSRGLRFVLYLTFGTHTYVSSSVSESTCTTTHSQSVSNSSCVTFSLTPVLPPGISVIISSRKTEGESSRKKISVIVVRS